MKKLFFLLCYLAFFLTTYAENNESDHRRYEVSQNPNVAYRLYPTSNNWNFLKLDTRTGQVWGVQFSVDSDEKSFEYPIATTTIEAPVDVNIGRFTLYPTSNYWNFLLLDQKTGRVWQVQFSLKNSANNMRFPIN